MRAMLNPHSEGSPRPLTVARRQTR